MFDIGWSELLVIAIVALIVVGPKDLPIMFRRAGQFVGRMRAMASEFTRAMDEAADATGVNEIKTSLKEATSLEGTGLEDMTDTMRDYGDQFRDLNPVTKVKKEIMGDEAEKKPAKKTTAKKTAAKKTATKKTSAKKKT
ncbi:MAG: Sec-independent protein translocase protein TatB [Pseudomonadota bacterium]